MSRTKSNQTFPGPKSRSRWTDDQARAVLGALGASGMSLAAFAAEQSIDPQRLYWWRRKFGGGQSPSRGAIEKARPTFVELAPRPAPERSARFTLSLPSGAALRIDGEWEAASIRMLMAILREVDAC